MYEFLKEQRLVAPAQLDELNEEHKATGKPLADVVVDLGIVEKDELLRRIAEHLGYDYVPELPVQFPGEAIAAITGKLARDYGVMPMRADEQNIDLLVTDPFNTQAVDDLTFALNRNVRLFFADPDKVEVQIKQHYGEDEESIDDLLQEIRQAARSPTDTGNRELSERDIESMAEQTPIIKFVNLVIGQAIRDKASDIHFEPFEHEFKIRYRIDGALYEMAPPPKQLALPDPLPRQGAREPQHRGAPDPAGRTHQDQHRWPAGGFAGVHAAHAVRRERRAPRARPIRSAARHLPTRHAGGCVQRHPRDRAASQRHLHRHRPDRLAARPRRSTAVSAWSTPST
jgi:hypothetical protein